VRRLAAAVTAVALLLAPALLLVPVVAAGGPAEVGAQERPLGDTLAAPMERAWAATQAALVEQGWGIDLADATAGVIVTKSHRIAGDDAGIQARNRRLRLRLRLEPVTPGETRIVIERELFERERVLWVEKDDAIVVHDPLILRDQRLERRLLAAIRKAL
jgi:hypothetical protein